MGGKSKQARVKNNAKPSNSSRSAELLGTAVPAFVGFSAHSDHGLVPFAPGFSDTMSVDALEPVLEPQMQLILRKMSKKDPVTKVKALQEFSEQLNTYDVEQVKQLLPLWPKQYQSLAIDVDHRVRECAQEVMNIIASKCKKAVAPYLKQLIPVWLASRFDNYAPAASIAIASFDATFASNANKVQEVCLYCQCDIVEYIVRNLTIHTAATLSLAKNCTPEEAEQKYQRVICCSLKTLSFFLGHTNDADIHKVHQSMQDMLANGKFWSYAKSKVTSIKASWFELLYNLLQNSGLGEILDGFKAQLIGASFQNIDDAEPLIAPHVWGCILLVQSTYEDWYNIVNLKKAVLPKLSSFLRYGCNKNANAICPNLLPFLSKLTQDSLKESSLNDVHKQFFDDMKTALTTLETSSKSDYSAITTAYFECIRYVMQQINTALLSTENTDDEDNEDCAALRLHAKRLLNENIMSLLTWCLINETIGFKYIIVQTSALIAFWAEPSKTSVLYAELLHIFWADIIAFITDGLLNKHNDEIFFNHIIELIDKLYTANPKIEDQRVKFAESDCKIASAVDAQRKKCSTTEKTVKKSPSSTYIESELRELVVQLVRLSLGKCANELSAKYIFKVRKLLTMFCDAEFYAQISEEQTIMATLQMFERLVQQNLDAAASEEVIDIIFEILNCLTRAEMFAFIETNLLKLETPVIQQAVLNRLLSYPLNVEPEVRTMLSQQPEASNSIVAVARDVLKDDSSKDSLNLLRKCFFQTENGDILIGSATVDAIVEILAEPLTAGSGLEHLMDVCGSFIAQIMPVICSGGNSSQAVQLGTFLKLFKFSIEHMPDDDISEDTLWEMSTCWQDALSSQDIISDNSLLQQCKQIVDACLQRDALSIEAMEAIASAIKQFIICSTEHIENEAECVRQIDLTLSTFFEESHKETLLLGQQYCVFLEALHGNVSLSSELHAECLHNRDMRQMFRQMLLSACTIYKLVSKPIKQRRNSVDDDAENTEDYCDTNENVLKQWSDTLYAETLRCISVAAAGDAFVNYSQFEPNLEMVAIQLSQKVQMFLREGSDDFIDSLKERMLNAAAAKDNDITAASRSLLYLAHINQYAQFEENAIIVLLEELSEFFVTHEAFNAYVNTLQYLLPQLSSKAINMQMPIMRTNPSATWIKAAVFRCLVLNNFNCDYNDKSDHNIIAHTLKFLSEVSEKQHVQKELLLYNVEIQKQPNASITDTVEFINLLCEVIKQFPYELSIKHWDAIRIGLSSWVLSVSKSIDHISQPQVSIFVVHVFELFAALANFINNEKLKSSTEFLKNIIDEWENLFARDVNLVLFKSYYKLVAECYESTQAITTSNNVVLELITPAMELLNYGVVFNYYHASTKENIDSVLNFLLKNLSSSIHCVRTHCVYILKQLTQYCVSQDIEIYESKSENVSTSEAAGDWHFLAKFEDYIGRYEILISKYLDEFNYKLTDIVDMKPMERNACLSYMLLWDCIMYVCSNAPITLRSLYTQWLHEKRYEENLLQFLFRAMPTEILKNHDSKIMVTEAFKGLTWQQIKDRNLSVEKYACHLYAEVLRKLPAVVRKWWNTAQSRQKTFVDKLTTSFVSPIICSEELKAIASKKEKHENMQVNVHTSTREVLAVYAIDEARMELVITLAPNYPLGSVKVESGKQIGGRLTSRNIGMQLTIFLTHQNGSIFDGLTLWKNNLDKKFEGVEECYVCYTVIHQDTCQLPKLTCKTCRKKFHGPCLYKWFTTSSKSTCPICRNVF